MKDFAHFELWICDEKRLFLAKRKISIEIMSYVCCMQCMQHIFNKWWNMHLCQIEVNHVTWMLALSWFEVFTWEAIFTKVKQIYLAVIRSEIIFKASV